MNTNAPRQAFVMSDVTARQVEVYLPSNYIVRRQVTGMLDISGRDNAGWTLDGYVIPRLASGLIVAEEVTA